MVFDGGGQPCAGGKGTFVRVVGVTCNWDNYGWEKHSPSSMVQVEFCKEDDTKILQPSIGFKPKCMQKTT